MTQTAINYAKVLYELGIDKTIIEETEEAFKKVPKLRTCLLYTSSVSGTQSGSRPHTVQTGGRDGTAV